MGRKVAREKGRRYKNWELDFVRGLHQGRALSSLAADLTISTGIPVRLMSIWLDKNAWVTWKDSAGHLVSRRELADLAVVVRQPMGGKVAQWMWLLQAKRTMHLLDSYVGSSSLHELDLLHRMPDFSLLEGDGKTRRLIASNIALANEFAIGKTPAGVSPWPCPGVVPWTFLDFDSDVKDASSAARNHFSPVSARWLGTPSAPAGSWAEQWLRAGGGASPLLASYTACLLGIISGQQVAWRHPGHASACRTFAPGAPLDPSVYPQWHRLKGAATHGCRNRHAGNAAYVAALLQRPAGWLTWPLGKTHGPQRLAHFANQGAIWCAGGWIIPKRYGKAERGCTCCARSRLIQERH
ncbi:hypothetical protein [Stenotrophomonas sepilia]|uniref:hypothetical protein n=1 Tax=Stenotrophomonas sepilia TaxID=2860290 RepID=UPI002E77ECDA|nr:hypothetical protein [Stenotrophomonas sepilia]